MAKWEFQAVPTKPVVEGLSRTKVDIDKLNELGAEGWELVEVNNESILKREIPEDKFDLLE